MSPAVRQAGLGWRRAERVLVLALALGGLAGIARVSVHAAGTEAWRFRRFLLDLAILEVNRCTALALGLLLVYLACRAALRPATQRERASSFLAACAALSPLLLPLAAGVNRRLLPGKFELVSIAGNLALAGGALVACGLVSWLLLRALPTAPARARRGPRPLWALGAALLALNAAGLLPRSPEAPPNVIILLIDVLRADRLGAYGYDRPTSPHIDAFARDAVLFRHAISQSTFTKTSVASLFAGLNPQHHGVYRGNLEDTSDRVTSDVLPTGLATLAERVGERGLYAIAWITNPHLAAYMGFSQGFVEYREPRDRSIEHVVDDVLDWARAARHQPFFAYVHFIDLHGPYRPEPPFDTLYGVHSDLSEKLEAGQWKRFRDGVNAGEVELTRADVEQLSALHDGLLTSMDREIGRLLDGLEALGLYEDSLIVVTSDHGDGFMEHGFIGHGMPPYDELARIPLIVKLPRSGHAGRRIDAQVRLIDLAPTIAELTGSSAEDLDGVSLLRHLEADGMPRPAGDGAARAVSWVAGDEGTTLSIRTRTWKFILFPDESYELYDLERDPGETADVAPRHPVEVTRFLALARDALEEGEKSPSDRIDVAPDSIEQLRALGYLD